MGELITLGGASLPSNGSPYDAAFFASIGEGSLQSARVIVPILTELVRPASVVDIGCGQGAWLRAFQENGVGCLQGLDGPWVDCSRLLIDPRQFHHADLCRLPSVPGRYDLAVCLEVGEHLPHRVAPQLIKVLTESAPLVLFSAAVPGQGGTSHVNEQWPEYWKRLFARHGYRQLDPVRRKVLHDDRVEWWYRQNTYLYASAEALATSPALRAEEEFTRNNPMQYVYADVLGRYTSLRGLLAELPRAAWRASRRVMGL